MCIYCRTGNIVCVPKIFTNLHNSRKNVLHSIFSSNSISICHFLNFSNRTIIKVFTGIFPTVLCPSPLYTTYMYHGSIVCIYLWQTQTLWKKRQLKSRKSWDVLSWIRLELLQLPVPQLIWGGVMPRRNHGNSNRCVKILRGKSISLGVNCLRKVSTLQTIH